MVIFYGKKIFKFYVMSRIFSYNAFFGDGADGCGGRKERTCRE